MASFLDGLLGPAINSATIAAGAHEQGLADANKTNEGSFYKQLEVLRQKHAQDQADQMHAAQIQNYQSEERRRTAQDAKDAAAASAPHWSEGQGGYVTAPKEVETAQPDDVSRVQSPTGEMLNADTGEVAPPQPKLKTWQSQLVRPQGATAPAKNPIMGSPAWQEAKKFEAGLKPEPQPKNDELKEVSDGKGGTKMVWANPRTHGIVDATVAPKGSTAGLAAPMAAKVGQFGEMLKKADDLFQLTDGLDVTLGNSAARDVSEHGVGIGALRIPGTKGVGSLMMNRSPEYAQYQAALAPFILAAAHALSGARINQDQVEQIRKSIELAPGDFANPAVRAQKAKNMLDLINSIGGSLPASAIGAQENQMGAGLDRMTARGYKRSVSGLAGSPHDAQQPPPAGVDAAKYATNPKYKAWVDAQTGKP